MPYNHAKVAALGAESGPWPRATDQQTAPGTLQDYATFPRLVDEMLKSGFSAEEVGKMLGGNFLRLWQEASRPA
jgi:microsomal dipeptidase-like Zn-dependent dipeptidase